MIQIVIAVSMNSDHLTTNLYKKLLMRKNSRKQKKKQWRSSQTDPTKASRDQSLPDASESLSLPVKLLSKCSEVTMKQFKACLCHDDLRALIVSGEPSHTELAEAWMKLFYEYCDLAEEAETLYRTKLMANLFAMKLKDELASGWVKMLEFMHDERIAESLRIIGYEFNFDVNDPKQYSADLARVKAEIAFLRLTIKEKSDQLEVVNKSSTTEQVDEKYFATIYYSLNNYSKREAVNDQTFVEMYCAALRAYTGYSKTQNIKAPNGRF